jgi:hypothetical protein
MAEESDGIEEAIEGQLRVVVTAAGQVAERMVRMREEDRRRAASRHAAQARELESRFDAQRRAARAELASVHQPDWWDRAGPGEIGHAWQVARAWASEDPEAVRAEQRIRAELQGRYGVDVDATGPDAATMRAALDQARLDRDQAGQERHRAEAETAEAQRLLADAAHQDQLAADARSGAGADPDEQAAAAVEVEQRAVLAGQPSSDARSLYDSAQRRASTAERLQAQGLDGDLVATRMRADISQATPPIEAVKRSPRWNLRARRARTGNRAVHAQRSGPSR